MASRAAPHNLQNFTDNTPCSIWQGSSIYHRLINPLQTSAQSPIWRRQVFGCSENPHENICVETISPVNSSHTSKLTCSQRLSVNLPISRMPQRRYNFKLFLNLYSFVFITYFFTFNKTLQWLDNLSHVKRLWLCYRYIALYKCLFIIIII